MMRRRVLLFLLSLLGLAIAMANLLAPPPPAVDFGRWRVLVIQSDDWGFEGWFPDMAAAEALADLLGSLPQRLSPYATSSLEEAAEVDSLAALLAGLLDADDLPAVLQANSVVAGVGGVGRGPSVTAPGVDIPLHASGSGGPYFRAGLDEAIDAAIARGVWQPELHGLTHFRLEAFADARRRGDPIALRAAARGVIAYDGWLQDGELWSDEPGHAQRMAKESVRLFTRRFGRRPGSIIAPDYVWGPDDERAWQREGIRVVQGKREQFDPAIDPTTAWGRVRKRVARWRDRLRGRFVYIERNVDLEPYGDSNLDCAQGAREAVERIQQAWARGEAAVLSTHRVQYSNFDPWIAAVGRAHLRAVFQELDAEGLRPRVLVDEELQQLSRSGISVSERGPWRIVRNYAEGPRRPQGRWSGLGSFPPGVHVELRAGASDRPDE